MSSGALHTARFVGWLLLGALGTIIVMAIVGLFIGQRPFTVLTGSMSPTIAAGDVVVVKKISPLDAQVGNIVSFTDPGGTGEMITHRVRSIRSRGATVDFQTRGDANNVSERWTVARSGAVGLVTERIPAVGNAFVYLSGRPARLLLIVIPLLLLASLEIWHVWKPRDSAGADRPIDEAA
ncbi:unannotated protein [freshwater metagenome]|uniref:Unannotated protein n=1 Tax=freshwater metagenome TaxID=449393 RepID=A0A6J5ZDT9_9ZZZZ|nr:signal peptidase I [Actinomycetota bacterium]MSX11367.1 signal peptidase I [Actinomycetota bacterium]